MKQKLLLKVALISSITGLIALFFLSESIQIDESSIEKITIENKDEFVKIKGTITTIRDYDAVMVMEIKQPQSMNVVIFKNKGDNLAFQEGNEVEVIGKVDEYEGDMEIIAHRIRLLR